MQGATNGTCKAASTHQNSRMGQSDALARRLAFRRSRAVGFTLIEVMVVVAIIALLATIAVPSYLDHVRKGRRADAITRISQIQQAQERWRANNAAYGTLADLGVSATNADGFYSLSVSSNTAASYQILATATGAQSSDANCRFMSLTMSGGNMMFASGSTSSVANAAAANKQCWNR
jgi:type IV pilus assembly protein PilE